MPEFDRSTTIVVHTSLVPTTTTQRILAGAEVLFDRSGFHAVGIDDIAAEANVSTRTLYKHMGSKDGLVCEVLDQRRDRFFAALREGDGGVESLFEGLGDWFTEHGAHGCVFLRALAEYGEQGGPIPEAAQRYGRQLRQELEHHLAIDGCAGAVEPLIDQLVVLFEGATSAAVGMGPNAARVAGRTANQLISKHLEETR